MKLAKIHRIVTILVLFVMCVCRQPLKCHAEEEVRLPEEVLYAKSAVLMDGTSGRILYEKNGEEFLANASTTKILTCILALEEGNLQDTVTVSAYAATMPDVQLNIREGEQYLLKDLLYSLMLESHNDSAVAIAEHISGTIEAFAAKMNEKAARIGCKNTFFVTPNGLDGTAQVSLPDGTKEQRSHGSTARDLAAILRYCIRLSPAREEFLKITRTLSHSFSNRPTQEGKTVRSFTCRNRNAFLSMMEGALSGKTGFTNKAGYCYVGALRQGEEEYVIALLACGWPNNKTYKWKDATQLFTYGLEQYEYVPVLTAEAEADRITSLEVAGGQTERLGEQAVTRIRREALPGALEGLLLKENENITTRFRLQPLEAPVVQGQEVGRLQYLLGDEVIREERLLSSERIEKIDYNWCLGRVIEKFLF